MVYAAIIIICAVCALIPDPGVVTFSLGAIGATSIIMIKELISNGRIEF